MRYPLFAALLLCTTPLLSGERANHSSPAKVDQPENAFLQENNSKWYVGAGISFMDLFYYKDRGNDSDSVNSGFLSYNSSSESTTTTPSLGYNVFVGYSHNQFIDLEFKGLQLVTPFKNGFNTDLSSTGDNDVDIGTTKLYFASFGPYVLINLPICTCFTPYVRSGMVTNVLTFKRSYQENSTFDTDDNLDSGSQKRQIWTEKMNIGLGFKSTWRDMITLRVEYETPTSNNILASSVVNLTDDFYIPGVLSASLLFKF